MTLHEKKTAEAKLLIDEERRKAVARRFVEYSSPLARVLNEQWTPLCTLNDQITQTLSVPAPVSLSFNADDWGQIQAPINQQILSMLREEQMQQQIHWIIEEGLKAVDSEHHERAVREYAINSPFSGHFSTVLQLVRGSRGICVFSEDRQSYIVNHQMIMPITNGIKLGVREINTIDLATFHQLNEPIGQFCNTIDALTKTQQIFADEWKKTLQPLVEKLQTNRSK